MTWWTLPIALVVGWFLGRLLRSMFREHDIATKHIKHAARQSAFNVANEEREILEEQFKHLPFPPPPPKRHESPWDYTRRVADMGYLKLKPWEPSWGGMQTTTEVSLTITQSVWTTTDHGGVVHRVGYVRLAGGSSMPVRFCEPTLESTTRVDEHRKELCPLITCIMCIPKVQD